MCQVPPDRFKRQRDCCRSRGSGPDRTCEEGTRQGTGQRVRRPDRRHARKMRTGAGHYPRMARRNQDDLRAGRVQDPEGSPSQWRQHKVRRGSYARVKPGKNRRDAP